jgi:hypothetical protein
VRSEIRTGCVAPTSLWRKKPLGLDIRRGCVDDLQVSRVVVIALQQPFVVGSGSNERNAFQRRRQRQYPVIGQQDDRLCDGLTS